MGTGLRARPAIPPAGRPFPRKSGGPDTGRAGFTFIELLLVLAVMSLLLALAAPAFQTVLRSEREREMNRLASVIRVLRNEAILGQRRFRLRLDLEEGGYRVEERGPTGTYRPREEPALLRPHRLPEGLELVDAKVYGRTVDALEQRTVDVAIDASGYVTPFLLHLREGQQQWTLRVSGFTARTELLSGYRDELQPRHVPQS